MQAEHTLQAMQQLALDGRLPEFSEVLHLLRQAVPLTRLGAASVYKSLVQTKGGEIDSAKLPWAWVRDVLCASIGKPPLHLINEANRLDEKEQALLLAPTAPLSPEQQQQRQAAQQEVAARKQRAQALVPLITQLRLASAAEGDKLREATFTQLRASSLAHMLLAGGGVKQVVLARLAQRPALAASTVSASRHVPIPGGKAARICEEAARLVEALLERMAEGRAPPQLSPELLAVVAEVPELQELVAVVSAASAAAAGLSFEQQGAVGMFMSSMRGERRKGRRGGAWASRLCWGAHAVDFC